MPRQCLKALQDLKAPWGVYMKYYVFIQVKPKYCLVSMISNYQKSWSVKTSILELLLLQSRHKCAFLQKFSPKRGVNTRKKLKNENISSGVNSLTLIWYIFMYYTYMYNKNLCIRSDQILQYGRRRHLECLAFVPVEKKNTHEECSLTCP